MLIQVEGGTNAGRRRVRVLKPWTCYAGHQNYSWATACRQCKEARDVRSAAA